MNCQEFQEKLLEPTALAAFDQNPEAVAHAAACAECRRQLEWSRKIADGFSAMAQREPPAELRARILRIPEVMAEKPVTQNSTSDAETGWFPGWRWLSGMGLSFAGAFLIYVFVVRPFDTSMSVREPLRSDPKGTQISTLPAVPAAQPAPTTTAPAAAVVPVPPENQMSAVELAKASATETTTGTGQVPPADSVQPIPTMAPTTSTGGLAGAGLAGRPAEPAASAVFQVAAAPAESAKSAIPEKDGVQEVPTVEMAFAPPPKVVGTPLNTVVGEPLVTESGTTAVPSAPMSPSVDHEAESFDKSRNGAEKSFMMAKTTKETKSEINRGRHVPSSEGDILLREAVPADAFAEESKTGSLDDQPLLDTAATGDQFARDFRASKKETAAMPAQRSLPDLEHRRGRLLEIVQRHADKVIEGPIDLNQWILAGWITVKERISLAAPQGRNWVARQESGSWKIELEP